VNKKRPFALSYESDGVMGKNGEKHPRRPERQQVGKQAPDFFNMTPSSE